MTQYCAFSFGEGGGYRRKVTYLKNVHIHIQHNVQVLLLCMTRLILVKNEYSKSVLVHIMYTYGGEEELVHSFTTSGLD
jgi:hypothetical protein